MPGILDSVHLPLRIQGSIKTIRVNVYVGPDMPVPYMLVYTGLGISTMPVYAMSVNHDPVNSGSLPLTPYLDPIRGSPPTLVPEAGVVLQPRMKGRGSFTL